MVRFVYFLINYEFLRKSIATRIEVVRFILSSMTLNSGIFEKPTPTLEEYRQVIEAYEAAMQKALAGDRTAIKERNNIGKQLEALTKQLGIYVMLIANGDEAKVTASGFPLRKKPERREIGQVQNVRAKNTGIEGEIELIFDSILGANAYIILRSLTPDISSSWEQVATTPRCKVRIGGLQQGKYYYFQVKALGRANQGEPSDVARVFAA